MNNILLCLILLTFLRFVLIKGKSVKDSPDYKPKLLDEILGGVDNLWQKQVSNIQRYEDCKRKFGSLHEGVGSCFKVLVGGLTPEEQQYIAQQEQQQAQFGNIGENNPYNNYPSYLAQQQQLLNAQQQGQYNNAGQYGQMGQSYGNQGYWPQSAGQGQQGYMNPQQGYEGQQGYLNPQVGQGAYGGQGQQGYYNPQQGQGYYGQNVEQQGYLNPQQQGQGYYGQPTGQFSGYTVKTPHQQSHYSSIPQSYLFNLPVGTNNGYGNTGMQQQFQPGGQQQFVSPGAIFGAQQPGYYPQAQV